MTWPPSKRVNVPLTGALWGITLLVCLVQPWVPAALANTLVNQDPPGGIQNSPSITRDAVTQNLVAAYVNNPFAATASGVGASYLQTGAGTWQPSTFLPPLPSWWGSGTELDPSVASDGAGLTYACLAAYDGLPPWGTISGIYVHTSTDGGRTFRPPVAVSTQPGPLPFEIKPKIEVNDFRGSTRFRDVYAVWERDLPDWIHSNACFSRSSGGGGTVWSVPVDINDNPGSDFVLWPDLGVASNGDIVAGWLETSFSAQGQAQIRVDRSSDGGQTFGPDRTAVTFWSVPATLTDSWGGPSYSAMSYPSVEVDPSNPNRIGIVYAGDPDTGVPPETRLDTGDQPPGSADAMLRYWMYPGNNVICGNGFIHAVWTDFRNPLYGIYYRRSPNGTATWPGQEIRLSTQSPDNFRSLNGPSIAASGSNVYVVWDQVLSADPPSGWRTIYFNRSTNDGQGWLSSAVSVNRRQVGCWPALACNGSQVLVAWAVPVDTTRTDIYVNRSTDGGATWGGSENLVLQAGYIPHPFDMASAGNTVVIVWTQGGSGGSSTIQCMVSQDGGQSWSGPTRLDRNAPPGFHLAWWPRVRCSGNGSVYVTWVDNRQSVPTTNCNAYFACSYDSGVTWQPEVRLNTGVPPGASIERQPQVASNGNDVYVAYESQRTFPGTYHIYVNHSQDGGLTWLTSEPRLDTGSRAFSPRLSVDGSRVYVVWNDMRNGSQPDIYGAHSTDSGQSWVTPDYRIDIGDAQGQNPTGPPQVACDNTGPYYLWADSRSGLGDIYASQIRVGPDEGDVFYVESTDAGTTWKPPLRVNDDNTTRDQTHPWLDIKPNGIVDVIWYDKRNDPNDRNPDVYFAALLPGATAFIQNVRVTTQPIASSGAWLGDYNWIDVDAGIAHMVWTDTRRDPWNGDIYYDNRLNPSLPQFGACCLQGRGCVLTTPGACDSLGGIFMGVQTPCDPDPCVELPDWGTHDVGDCLLTVTDQGTLGFMDGTQTHGSGFVYPRDGANQLYIGGLWVSDGPDYVANRDYDADPDREWIVSTNPDGRIRVEEDGDSDQDILAGYTDRGAARPHHIYVSQESWAYAAPDPADDFVILNYSIKNAGSIPMADAYAGIFLDLDLGTSAYDDEGEVAEGQNLAFMKDPERVHVGVNFLEGDGENPPLANLSLIHNPTYVWPNSYMLDADKYAFLSAADSAHQMGRSFRPDDWGVIASIGPFTLAPGESLRVAFALVAGLSREELEEHAGVAQRVYGRGITGTHQIGGTALQVGLLPNTPNPFSDRTEVRFALARPEAVELGVYDVSGRQVRLLLSGPRPPGRHSMMWDGRDQQGHRVSGGVYFLRLTTGSETMSRSVVRLR